MSDMSEGFNSLTQFLIDNPQTDIREQVYVSKRFEKAVMPFTIKAMSGSEFSEYQKEALGTGGRGRSAGRFNAKRFNELIAINHTVEPNFKDATSIAAAGCVTPEQFMDRVLRAGEINELVARITELSGFDEEPAARVNEVKNS
jgi:hypothetical protein